MNSFIATIVARWSRGAFALSVIYTAACVLLMVTGLGGDGIVEYVGAWGSFPVSVMICVVMWPSMTDPALNPRRRLAWRLIFAALVLDIVASIGWGYGALTENVTFGSWPDVLYIFYYPLAAGAFGLLYLDLGGRVRTRSFVDAFADSGGEFGWQVTDEKGRGMDRNFSRKIQVNYFLTVGVL